MAQLSFKQAKLYVRFQNDRTKGRMDQSWAVTSFTEVTLRIFNLKSQENTKQDVSPAIEDSKYDFCK